MKSLTEQWKKGELPEGFYYIIDDEEVIIDYYLCDYWERHFDSDVHQVLAPVPCYKELQEKQKSLKVLAEAYCKEKEENRQLKELLEDCCKMLAQYHVENSEPSLGENIELLTKINGVLK